jgi:hypothetical protein
MELRHHPAHPKIVVVIIAGVLTFSVALAAAARACSLRVSIFPCASFSAAATASSAFLARTDRSASCWESRLAMYFLRRCLRASRRIWRGGLAGNIHLCAPSPGRNRRGMVGVDEARDRKPHAESQRCTRRRVPGCGSWVIAQAAPQNRQAKPRRSECQGRAIAARGPRLSSPTLWLPSPRPSGGH